MITPSLFSRCNPKCIFYLFRFLAPGSKQWWGPVSGVGVKLTVPASNCQRTREIGNTEKEEWKILCPQPHSLISLRSRVGFQAVPCRASWQKIEAFYCIKKGEKLKFLCRLEKHSDPHSPQNWGSCISEKRGARVSWSKHSWKLSTTHLLPQPPLSLPHPGGMRRRIKEKLLGWDKNSLRGKIKVEYSNNDKW